MKRLFLTFLVIVGGCRDPGEPVTIALSVSKPGEVNVVVTNPTKTDIVVLSPDTPAWGIAVDECKIFLTNKVDPDHLPYEFAPDIMIVPAGRSREFRATLDPLHATAKCAQWEVTAEYVFLTAPEIQPFRSRTPEELRQYVVRHQRTIPVARTVALRAFAQP